MSSVPTELKVRLKEEARRLGFELVGIARPAPSAHAQHYRDWLAHNYHAEMSYLERPDAVAKRFDPQALMPEARSVVVVGLNYYPGSFPEVSSGEGRVSRYAWGADYHDVMMDMLAQLANWIERQVDESVAHRAYVDFGPVLERELAALAGFGWLGKNTCLIHPTMGSYVFLGELLLALDLEPDAEDVDDRCGSCTACLEACPTGALVSPRVLDARRCISYLTIEHRGAIPETLRPLLGDWVFGCDVCQEVCPWNRRFARATDPGALNPARPTLDVIELLSLDARAFQARFENTPLWRPRRAGLLRNAAVVLGNRSSRAAVPALERACRDVEPLVADHARWALERVRSG